MRDIPFLLPFLWNPIDWLMDNVVDPMIDLLVGAMRPILEDGVKLFLELLMSAMADIFYDILVIMLKAVSFFSNAFMIFSGVYNISLQTAPDGKFEQSNTFLLQYIMGNASITRTYWILTVLCAALCLIFTGISILRSINGADFDPKNSVGKIWGRLGKTMLTFLVIPALMLAGIELSTVVAGRLVENTFETGKTSVDNVIFLATTMDAARDSTKNGNNASFTDDVRGAYLRGEKSYEAYKDETSVLSKSNRKASDDFDFTKIDYLTGYILCGFMVFILMGAALFAVRRLLEILLLYVSAPFFVASIPLDEGKKFEAWRDMFVAKLVSCYGLVLMMMMYLTMVPVMMGGDLRLAEDGTIDSLMKLLLLLGGALAIKNGHSFVLGIISPTAAQHAQSSTLAGFGLAAMAGGRLRGAMAGGGRAGSMQSQPAVMHASAADAQKYNG